MTKHTIVFAAALTILCACSEETVDRDKEAQTLMDLSREWSQRVGEGEMELAYTVWADDAVMLPPNFPMLDGKVAIREYIERANQIPGFKISWEPLRVQVSESGDMAYMIERNVIELDGTDGEKIVRHGKVVTVWQKNDDGKWKNVVDVWNSAPGPIG
jgi:ketosteroid isomerase-like protein